MKLKERLQSILVTAYDHAECLGFILLLGLLLWFVLANPPRCTREFLRELKLDAPLKTL